MARVAETKAAFSFFDAGALTEAVGVFIVLAALTILVDALLVRVGAIGRKDRTPGCSAQTSDSLPSRSFKRSISRCITRNHNGGKKARTIMAG